MILSLESSQFGGAHLLVEAHLRHIQRKRSPRHVPYQRVNGTRDHQKRGQPEEKPTNEIIDHPELIVGHSKRVNADASRSRILRMI